MNKPMKSQGKSSWLMVLPVSLALAGAMITGVGCGKKDKPAELKASPAPPMPPGEPPPGDEALMEALKKIGELQAQNAALQTRIDLMDNQGNEDSINSDTCSSIASDGALVRCNPNGSPNPGAEIPPNATLPPNAFTANEGAGNGLADNSGSGGTSGNTSGSGSSDSGSSDNSIATSTASVQSDSGGASGASGGGGSFSAMSATGSGVRRDIAAADEGMPGLPGAVQSGGGGGRGQGGGAGSAGGVDISGSWGGGGGSGGGSAGVSGANWVGSSGRAPASAQNQQDPPDYLDRISPEESLFKVIERRYTQTAMQWTREQLQGQGGGASAR